MVILYQTAKFNTLIYNVDLDSTAKFNYHQYFLLYDITNSVSS